MFGMSSRCHFYILNNSNRQENVPYNIMCMHISSRDEQYTYLDIQRPRLSRSKDTKQNKQSIYIDHDIYVRILK